MSACVKKEVVEQRKGWNEVSVLHLLLHFSRGLIIESTPSAQVEGEERRI